MAESNRVELLTSTYAVAEAVRNLHHAGQLQQLTDLLNRLEIGGDCLSPDTIPIPPVLNNKDKPILRAAIAMHATHLLTGDITYFGQIFGKRISGVMIQTPSTYLESR
jgi:predicted nucleic acid-binding protein